MIEAGAGTHAKRRSRGNAAERSILIPKHWIATLIPRSSIPNVEAANRRSLSPIARLPPETISPAREKERAGAKDARSRRWVSLRSHNRNVLPAGTNRMCAYRLSSRASCMRALKEPEELAIDTANSEPGMK